MNTFGKDAWFLTGNRADRYLSLTVIFSVFLNRRCPFGLFPATDVWLRKKRERTFAHTCAKVSRKRILQLENKHWENSRLNAHTIYLECIIVRLMYLCGLREITIGIFGPSFSSFLSRPRAGYKLRIDFMKLLTELINVDSMYIFIYKWLCRIFLWCTHNDELTFIHLPAAPLVTRV